MRRFAMLALALLCLGGLATAPAAPAAGDSIVYKVYKAYQAKGSISPCQFSADQLKQALSQVGPDSNQYSPDFREAIQNAIEARAAGACDKKSAPAKNATPVTPAPTQTPTQPPSTPAPQVQTVAPTTTPQPSPDPTAAPTASDNAINAAAARDTSDGSDAPAPLVVLAILAGAALLSVGLWSALRWAGFDPPWVGRWRHATEEAGWRASNAWAEFADWVRFGR